MIVVCKALEIKVPILRLSGAQNGQNIASLSAIVNTIDEHEKTRKPKITRTECIQYLCFLADERTRILKDNIATGAAKKIKATDVEGQQLFYHLLESKIADALYDKNKVP